MINPQHLTEWRNSCVDPAIIELNVISLSEYEPHEYLLYSQNLSRRNDGRLRDADLRHYQHLELGGWWCSGLDPLVKWQPMLWGCFKPNRPRLTYEPGKKPKPLKYEHPPKTPTRAFFLNVPDFIWEQVAARHNIPITDADRPYSFWHWVWLHNLPIVICEGAKKAGCLLSLGYAAIGLPGIYGGVRTKDEEGNKVKPYFIPELKHFATLGRQVDVCFDHDTKLSTIQSVNWEISKLGQSFTASGCQVRVIQLPGPEKGVDDFVAAQGGDAFDALYASALEFDSWTARQPYRLTYIPQLRLNQRYLGTLPFPESGLVCIQSPKGTGKTSALESLITQASSVGRRTLVITHRIQLGRAICAKLGLDWIEDVRQSPTKGMLGYGLCIDSLHPTSQARFNPEDWQGALVVLDEVEQVIWHALNSSTCYENRVVILQTLQQLIHTVLSTGGLVIAQDADLSDLSIDYLQSMAGIPIQPWVVVNDWKPSKGWDVTFYATKDPAPLFAQLEQVIEGGPVLVIEDSQKVKGKWSARNTETQLKKRFPDKQILRIDSESVADPHHPAHGCVERINKIIGDYDIVIATPTIGTGVSIDLRGHFHGVFGIFKGAIPITDALQALARVRDENVPRYIWAKEFGLGKIGNGSASYRAIIKSQNKVIKANIRLLQDLTFDIDAATDPIHTRTWAQMAARINASMWNYRDALTEWLTAEGHQVQLCRENVLQLQINQLREQELAVSNAHDWERLEQLGQQIAELQQELEQRQAVAQQLSEEASDVRTENKEAEAKAVETAYDIGSERQYQELKDKRTKTSAQQNAQRKYELTQRYGVPVTADLKLRDDDRWYPKLRLHYYLLHNPEFVKERDRKHLADHRKRGAGHVCPQDLRFITAQVEVLQKLDFIQFLDPKKEFRGTDPEVEEFANLCKQYRRALKEILGVTIHPDAKPMEVVQKISREKLGFTLKCIRQERSQERDASGKQKRTRVYQYQPPDDGRDEIFGVWRARDTEALEKASQDLAHPLVTISAGTPPDIYINKSEGVPHPPVPSENPSKNPQSFTETGATAAGGESETVASDTPVEGNQTPGVDPSSVSVGTVVQWLKGGAEKLRVLAVETSGYVFVKSLVTGLFTHTHCSQLSVAALSG